MIYHSEGCLKNMVAFYSFELKLDMTNQRIAVRLFLPNFKEIVKRLLVVSLEYLE